MKKVQEKRVSYLICRKLWVQKLTAEMLQISGWTNKIYYEYSN